ncbi:ubiquinone biosynthesis protein coq4 [Sporothrix schenckii 1099-18]|uniref:4-hydroxy-3-methoxy-5-polyprenylbenzoate decarboxylase n=1 Tax=Sporothrix schenckii 1099-18 TaxID=1397361 RepID=A0A0F2MCV0_SPOSC|nr:ubiquinone biosynthesis protein coq4 [Sporothrix schenckii 1099-18]KJR86919.1 ubiquinone biosynthesis protein coq4 [Sporothrix schenckii 1099-18]
MRPIRLPSSRQLAQLTRPGTFVPVEALVHPHIRAFSVLNRPPPQYDGHVPLTLMEKGALTLGSAIGAFLDPKRADLIATLGEVSAGPVVRRLRDTMLADPTGRQILRDRPRITSASWPLGELLAMPKNTVGYVYGHYRQRYHMSPDVRDAVRYVDGAECAYVIQRYRECHDLYHAVLGLPPQYVEGEIALKAFEFVNTGLPMTGLSLVAVARLKPTERQRFFRIFLPWALRSARRAKPIINVYWEKELHTDAAELRARLGLEKPPNLHTLRKTARKQKPATEEGPTEAAATATTTTA